MDIVTAARQAAAPTRAFADKRVDAALANLQAEMSQLLPALDGDDWQTLVLKGAASTHAAAEQTLQHCERLHLILSFDGGTCEAELARLQQNDGAHREQSPRRSKKSAPSQEWGAESQSKLAALERLSIELASVDEMIGLLSTVHAALGLLADYGADCIAAEEKTDVKEMLTTVSSLLAAVIARRHEEQQQFVSSTNSGTVDLLLSSIPTDKRRAH